MISFQQFLLESNIVKIPISAIGESPVSDSFNYSFSGLYIPEINTLIMFEYARHSTISRKLVNNEKFINKKVNDILYNLYNKIDHSKYNFETSYQIIFRDMGIIPVSSSKNFHLITISGKQEQLSDIARLIGIINDETIIQELGLNIFKNGSTKFISKKYPNGKNLPTTSFKLQDLLTKEK